MSRNTLPFIATLLILLLAACGGEDSEPDSPTATAVQDDPVSTPDSSPTTESPELEIAEAAEEEPFTKPTPPGGIAPTAEPAPDSSFDADGDGWMTWEEVTTGVHATFPNYEWPANYVTDADTLLARREAGTNARGPGVAETNFQSGIEYSLPGEANMCAWVFNWLDAYADGDQATMDESMGHIEPHVADLWSLSGIRQDLEDDLARAQLGDIAGLQRLSSMFCDRSVFEEASVSQTISRKGIVQS